MEPKNLPIDQVLVVLRERAKELNCLYQVEEVLAGEEVPLPGIFNALIRTIPSGWQYPDICRARIVYRDQSYQDEDYVPTAWRDSAEIREEDELVGSLEVSYTREVPGVDDGFFLLKERKLIKTIADRIGQTIFHRKLKRLLHEWETASRDLAEKKNREWMVITELVRRTDEKLYLHISRKMIYYLFWNGVGEARQFLGKFGGEFVKNEPEPEFDANSPSFKQSREKLIEISDQVFSIAARNLSDNEILQCLQKWIHENKISFLIKTIDSGGTALSAIIDAILRYRAIAGDRMVLAPSTEKWLRVSLIRRFFSDTIEFINIAKRHLEVSDFFDLVTRIIFHAGSNGKLGGKSSGLLLARHILLKQPDEEGLFAGIKVPRTWYITADSISEFLRHNDLEDINEQKYKDPEQVRIDYPNIIQLFKNSHFSSEIVKGLSMALDDFGDKPIIVRSSSLLEDRVGTAFSGKYKSLFLANQGPKQKRLSALLDAIAEVYASVFGPDPIIYRAEQGLLDLHEEMGIMIQEVVGTRVGPYFFPAFAGIAFSNNEFRWSPRLRREDGLIRMVPGMGTRAVDRVSNDYPVLVSPGQPALRVNVSPDEIRHYSPSWIDVINLETNCFETISVIDLLRTYGEEIPAVHQIVSIYRDGHISRPSGFDIDFKSGDLLVTFEGIITRTTFIRRVRSILTALENGFGMPVDIEFASDGVDFYLLQCRPQNTGEDSAPSPIPRDIPEDRTLFTARRYISGGRVPDITHVVWVNPRKYGEMESLEMLTDVGRAIGRLNAVLPKRQFILMGPGRWGSRGDIKLGVQVSYSDINNTAVLIEISMKRGTYSPELSFGTHFFQDLAETGIRYIPLYPDDRDVVYNELFFTGSRNMLPDILPEYAHIADTLKVIDIPGRMGGKILKILLNAELGESIGYFDEPEAAAESSIVRPRPHEAHGEEYWRWRLHMAEQIAGQVDASRFGVRAVYLIGSTANATAGPDSDIDLLFHVDGTREQREALSVWLEGWSLSLSEMNYLRTGYRSHGLLDVHMVTDRDIENRTSFAVKINAVTDPARPLSMKRPAS
ncbi:MAG TPA: PEP/pyruvate-binding domain-containing protein [Spirochaetota bacterium]|nr:PEP/pyruvate-binding domain-containing protein [Spirochaetota bacterium]HNU91980.1 PEP/pyruvate-binding domain-containing protein [Spirochaetota bacterium]HPI13399.1 PEP/pyruvate-binding domain-containing protein [Spirochaetota bacterium]HPV98595.1 PEP/pyruvate-binding domain-containing protein [Spirochaetota bacterium]